MKTTGQTTTRLLAALLAAVSLAGCSVKEDRDGCPCWVSVNVDRFIAAGHHSGHVLYSSSEGVYNDTTDFNAHIGTGYGITVPREQVSCAVVAGCTQASRFSRDVVYTAYHAEADPLFAYSETFTRKSDEYTVTAVPHKQYCRISFKHVDRDMGVAYPYVFRISCKYNGYNLTTRLPEPGEYVWVAAQDRQGLYSMNVPRQGSYEMLFEVLQLKSADRWEAVPVYAKELGEEIRKAGYDWTAEDLADMEVTVDFSSMTSTVSVRDWEEDHTYSDTVI